MIDFSLVVEVMEELFVCVVKLCYGVEMDICVLIDCKIGKVIFICVCIVVVDEEFENYQVEMIVEQVCQYLENLVVGDVYFEEVLLVELGCIVV